MAQDQNRRINPKIINQDLDANAVIKTFSPAYGPLNSAFAVAAVDAAKTAMMAARDTEAVKKGEWEAARDAAAAAEWAYHNLMLGVHEQVIAQYGSSSDQVQAIGLKKKSEYKRPNRQPASPAPPPAP